MKTILAITLVLLSTFSIAVFAQRSSTEQDTTSDSIADENRPPQTNVNAYNRMENKSGGPMQGPNNFNAGRAQ